MRSANIGKAAHITAAASGGPRFDPAMSPEERRAIGNGIWLCSNCATKIDVDADAYPTALLHEWKRIAEEAAHAEKGKRQAHPDDARNEVFAALTGAPMKLKQTAIRNTHAAAEQALGLLDSRFRVETAYSERTTTFTVHAREPVEFQVHIPAQLAPAWAAGLQDIADHGREARLPATGVKLTGSPLLEQMLAGIELTAAVIGPARPRKLSALRLKLIDPETGQTEPFDDLPSAFHFGAKSLSFDGSACGGALEISLAINRAEPAGKPEISISIEPVGWQGLDIRRLPHFDKLRRLVSRLRSSWRMEIEVEVDGLQIARLGGSMPSATDKLAMFQGFFEYVAEARKVSERFDAPIRFVHEHPITEDDFLRVIEVNNTIEGKRSYGKSAMNANIRTNIIAPRDAPSIKDALGSDEPQEVLWIENGGQLAIFGQPIQLPRMAIRLDGVRPIFPANASAIKAGEEFSAEWEPLDTFLLTYRYVEDGEALDLEPELVSDEHG